MRGRLALVLAVLLAVPVLAERSPAQGEEAVVMRAPASSTIGALGTLGTSDLTFDQPQTAGISGFRAMWDTPQPGALVFDAVHRSLLVRFPGAAAQVAAQVSKGYAVQKVELVLPFDQTELWPEVGYHNRMSFGNDELFRKVQPQWHAVAWALRKPWMADKDLGPTFNAYLHGAGYWAKYGAADTKQDRFPQPFGPTEVSYQQTEGRMDVTPVLTDADFGRTLADRLRRLENCGFLLRKWEVYDFRFRKPGDGAYEWGVSCGGRGVVIKPPRLVVTLTPAQKAPSLGRPGAGGHGGPLLQTLAARLKQTGAGGQPTAVMPAADELAALIQRFSLRQPDGMPDWQWQRVQELDALGGGYRIPDTPEGYAKWIDEMLADPPRYWNGWDVPDRLLTYYLYREALPAPVAEHYFQNYWTAWLMPDRPTKEFDHPQAIELWYEGKNRYYEKTGDWRGNASFYRDGYCYAMSTMNFNHTAALGALLGGHLIGSQYAVEDGRHGLEHWPLRTWAWFDGSTQESIDHYYFAITLSDQKMFADFGPTQLDRMMGRSMLAKSLDELTSAYHPGLRHFIASSGRTALQYALVTQDGLQHIMHTFSRRGALHDIGNPNLPGGMEPIGHDTPPGRIAQQTVSGPWAPEWVANMVDDKPLPYEMTNTYKMWGGHAAHPLWRRTYLGRHYGLASTDIQWGVVPIMAQWRRTDQPVSTLQELGALTLRCGINTTPLANQISGWMESQGNLAAMQHRNKLVVVSSPYEMAGREGVQSLQTTVALFNYQPQPTWEIYVDGQRVTTLPFRARASQRITIKDGVTYLGLVPLPATDLGRTDEVVLAEGEEQPSYPNSVKIRAALVIHSYNLQRDTPLEKTADWKPIDRAYGGFVVELGDATEYPDFAAFQQHLASAKLETRWEPENVTLHVTYASGQDTLEVGCRTDYKENQPSPDCFVYRRVNGQWPYLPPGLERDTTLTQQGTTGRLEKNGAVLAGEPGRMAYLQTEPVSGTYAGFNPLPDPTLWSLSVPPRPPSAGDSLPQSGGRGITVKADGRLSLARVIVRPKESKLWIDYATKADQTAKDMATALVVFGLPSGPVVERNGNPCRAMFRTVKIDGQEAYVIPLAEDTSEAVLKGVVERYRRAQEAFEKIQGQPDVSQTLLQARGG